MSTSIDPDSLHRYRGSPLVVRLGFVAVVAGSALGTLTAWGGPFLVRPADPLAQAKAVMRWHGVGCPRSIAAAEGDRITCDDGSVWQRRKLPDPPSSCRVVWTACEARPAPAK